MIYLVSDKIDVTNMPEVQKISPEESLHMINQWPVVQFDTETTGLDPHICSLTALQFGYKDFKSGEHNEIVVDAKTIDPKLYKGILESSHLIAHNYKFDAQFLYNYGIVPLDVYDTMVCEQTLYLGYKPGRVSMALGDVLYRYTGIKLDKSFQKFIARQGLTYQGILYAAGDVTYLQDIRKAQLMVAQSRNCTRAFTVENRFVPAVAYLEWCGIHLDEDLWKKKMEKDNAQYETCLTKLNEYVMNHTDLNTRFVTTYSEPSIFDDHPSFTPTCNVDWDSSAQVIPVFKALGFNTWSEKEHRDTVEEKHLTPQKGINDEFLKIYLDYKKSSKTITSYGQGHLNLINPNTGRLHTEFKSIGTVTGRMSSGGGDDEDSKGKINADLAFFKGLPANEVRYVNLQNLPSRGEAGKVTRACFTAEPGNVFISCDYAAEESRVQADVWNEKSLLDAFNNGIDTHNLYAKLCFPDELVDVDVGDVKTKRPDLRQLAKSAEFTVTV